MKTLIFGTQDGVRFFKEPLREPFLESYTILSSVGALSKWIHGGIAAVSLRYQRVNDPGGACAGWLLSCWTVTVPGSVHGQKLLCVAGSSRGHLHPVGGSL